MQARLPAHIVLPRVIEKSRKNKEKIREAIDVHQHGWIDGFFRSELRDQSLRAACDRAGVMQICGGLGSTRQHKAIERRQIDIEVVNPSFQPCNLFVREFPE